MYAYQTTAHLFEWMLFIILHSLWGQCASYRARSCKGRNCLAQPHWILEIHTNTNLKKWEKERGKELEQVAQTNAECTNVWMDGSIRTHTQTTQTLNVCCWTTLIVDWLAPQWETMVQVDIYSTIIECGMPNVWRSMRAQFRYYVHYYVPTYHSMVTLACNSNLFCFNCYNWKSLILVCLQIKHSRFYRYLVEYYKQYDIHRR